MHLRLVFLTKNIPNPVEVEKARNFTNPQSITVQRVREPQQ